MLKTERMILRHFRAEDAADYRRLLLDRMASPYALYDHQQPTDEESAVQITRYFATSDAFWLAEERETGDMIGSFILNTCAMHDARNLGYMVFSAKQGQGYATEACRRLIEYAFDTLKVQKLVTGTATINEPSVRLLQKLGFHKVGEAEVSFCNDENGTPIMFTGAEFELSR